jgi:hypothetical protein
MMNEEPFSLLPYEQKVLIYVPAFLVILLYGEKTQDSFRKSQGNSIG